VDNAAETGEGLAAGLILLTLQAGVLQPQVVERHGLRVDPV